MYISNVMIKTPVGSLYDAIKFLMVNEQTELLTTLLMESKPEAIAHVLAHLGGSGCGFGGKIEDEMPREADAIKGFISACLMRWDADTPRGEWIRKAIKEAVAEGDADDQLHATWDGPKVAAQ